MVTDGGAFWHPRHFVWAVERVLRVGVKRKVVTAYRHLPAL